MAREPTVLKTRNALRTRSGGHFASAIVIASRRTPSHGQNRRQLAHHESTEGLDPRKPRCPDQQDVVPWAPQTAALGAPDVAVQLPVVPGQRCLSRQKHPTRVGRRWGSGETTSESNSGQRGARQRSIPRRPAQSQLLPQPPTGDRDRDDETRAWRYTSE